MQRSVFVISGVAAFATIGIARVERATTWTDSVFKTLERRINGRLGVAAVEVLGPGRMLYREKERFALASVQKLALVMTVLARIDRHRERLERLIRFGRGDLAVHHSVIADQYPNGGAVTVEALCSLAISESDNTAANLLATAVGGPPRVTAYMRTIGFSDIRVAHTERDLPSRATPTIIATDGATPSAVAGLIARLAYRSPLSNDSTRLLLRWMSQTQTGARRLRAGLPSGWSVADKTGTYENAANDAGLISSPRGRSFAVAVFCQTAQGVDAAETAIRSVARAIAARFS
ncbi:MAG: class A beta-lactamase [Candidatus Eremiobacteraeota bacterium]|nr:class A beta-lactamase [Candidatus Eremiobacteraeota bacterium]